MPKSRARKKTKDSSRSSSASGRGGLAWGGSAGRGSGRINLVLGVLGAAAVIAGAYLWWQQSNVEGEFMALAQAGEPALSRVESQPNRGSDHLRPGQTHNYGEPFPTSGIHAPTWTQAGFYDEPQRSIELVHALEHGNIVIYYDE
ncbi:MAG TPA: DUF3105 domain-containing protein, partial [Kiloniellales bacterium]|nr:DUF3105 domain-containing protein [Kiloniellales bacterium]